MSHTLLTADNISVKGHHYTVDVVESIGIESSIRESGTSGSKIYGGVGSGMDKYKDDIIKQDVVHFDFTLLINGKLKTFGWSFMIEKYLYEENGEQAQCDYWSLVDYTDWNVIVTMLSKLGYYIDSNAEEVCFSQSVVDEWIAKIMN